MKSEVSKEHDNNLEFSAELAEPALYQVVLHNDDFTPMEFVVGILEKFFYMDRKQAADKTLEAHVKGKTVCGVFSKDFAESKILQVMEHAQSYEHPLNCSMEAV
jgi:ATP-dependent Clp protease adaptor protein ClpS